MPDSDLDEQWMWRAIYQAREAEKIGEVPVGAVLVDAEGKILAATSNRTIKDNDPTAHAEILALRTAAIRTGNYRLTGTTMYTTLEPCARRTIWCRRNAFSRLRQPGAESSYGDQIGYPRRKMPQPDAGIF